LRKKNPALIITTTFIDGSAKSVILKEAYSGNSITENRATAELKKNLKSKKRRYALRININN